MVSMKNKFFAHFELKVLSLVIAIVVWIIVANVDDYKTTKHIEGIEIEFVNGSAITKKNKVYEVPEGTTIDVVVKGRRKIVENLTREDFHAVADLSKMSITNAVKVDVSAVSSYIARDLTISNITDSVVVAVEDKVKKQLPITVRTLSDVASGYAIRSKTAAPNLITVEGAESAVNMIEEVVVDANVAGASRSLTTASTPIFLDKSGTVIDASKFTYDVHEIEISVEILKTKELAINVETTGVPKNNYVVSAIDYQPTSVMVVGEAEELAKVHEIVIDDIDVADAAEALETSVVIADYLPNGISLAEDTQEIMIKVMIEPVVEKTLAITNEDIKISGKNNGYTYTFKDGGTYTLNVRGLKDDLDNLKILSLAPDIDVTGYGVGTYTFTVTTKELDQIEVTNTLKVRLEIERE